MSWKKISKQTQGPIPKMLAKKYWVLVVLKISVFFESAILNFLWLPWFPEKSGGAIELWNTLYYNDYVSRLTQWKYNLGQNSILIEVSENLTWFLFCKTKGLIKAEEIWERQIRLRTSAAFILMLAVWQLKSMLRSINNLSLYL